MISFIVRVTATIILIGLLQQAHIYYMSSDYSNHVDVEFEGYEEEGEEENFAYDDYDTEYDW